MKLNYLSLSVFLLLSSLVLSQNPTGLKVLEKKYIDYFSLNREFIYVHLHKTRIVENEDLWLAAYSFDPRINKPNTLTTNLHLDIFNGQGNFIDSHVLYMAGGKGSGILPLNTEKFPPGEYILKASTTYMENFKEELEFYQSFVIMGEGLEISKNDEKPELHLLPEGGHLVKGIPNQVGVKLIDDSGKGIAFRNAKLLNSEDEIINDFKSNIFGMSRFSITPGSGIYKVILETLNGEQITKALPKAKTQGITMITNERSSDFVFSFHRTSGEIEQKNSEKFYLAIHKDGSIKNMEFNFPENKVNANLIVSKDSLFTGINTISVFNTNLQPILERLVFNWNGLHNLKIQAKKIGVQGDSLRIRLDIEKPIENLSLSVSVLPNDTKSYTPNHSIFSAFYLKPYIKGDIDSPSYYFSSGDQRQKSIDLDLLLLNQGWSQYSWDNVYKNSNEERLEPEIGFTIEGEITSRNPRKQSTVFVSSEKTGLFKMGAIDSGNNFKFEQLYLQPEMELNVGILDDKSNKVAKPGLKILVFPNRKPQDLSEQYQTFSLNELPVITDLSFLSKSFFNTTNSLDTINLIGERKDTDTYFNETNSHERKFTIEEKMSDRFYYITDFLAANGYRVVRTPTGVTVENNYPSSLNKAPYPLFILNGAPIFIPEMVHKPGKSASVPVHDFLYNLTTDEVESVIINKHGFGYGMQGMNGVIKINTRTIPRQRDTPETIESIILDKGYALNKKYYTPEYTSYSSKFFKEYGSIHWEPNLTFGQDGTGEFKIFNSLQSEIKLFIEGMNTQGQLISKELELKLR